MTLDLSPDLIENISKGRASLFLGAGASCEAGFPSSQDIAKSLAESAGGDYLESLKDEPLDTVADILYSDKKFGPQWVRQKVIELIESYHKKMKRPPSLAHQLVTKFKWRTIFTTNYDRLIEVAYDSSPDCVQRLIPMFQPDPQIWRREEEAVKLIKLNGSVDEAQRNCSHEIVLNFADQRKVHVSNLDFYKLLKEEAVTGPIVFVGFSFSHPGASEPATSPEFSELRELLIEMGPAGRSHYCVTPIDTSNKKSKILIKKLESSLIQIINANFGEFMAALIETQQTPLTALSKRPPVSLNIGQKTLKIEHEDYVKDKRHFEIIGTHLQESEIPTVAESLNGGENWSTFFSKRIIERASKEKFLKKLETAFESAPSILSFVASPGWGKTFLLKDIAADLSLKGRPIFWLNPYSVIETKTGVNSYSMVGGWDMRRIDFLVAQINELSNKEAVNSEYVPLIICDNCPQRTEDALTLFRYLTTNGREFVILITYRTNEFDPLNDANPLMKKSKIFRPEGTFNAESEIRNLIDFCSENKVAAISNASQKELIAHNIFESDASSAIILALQIIFDKQHRPFAEIVKDLWEKIENEKARAMILRVAALHRFGGVFFPRLFSLINTFPATDQKETWRIYDLCRKKGILYEEMEEDEPCVRTLHSLVAEKLTKVCGKSPSDVDDELLSISKALVGKNIIDLGMARNLLKQLNDYKITLSSEEKVDTLFEVIAESTGHDWVVCQQYSKYLLNKTDYETAYAWADRAYKQNINNSALQHHKGHILSRWGKFLYEKGDKDGAEEKFDAARKYFTLSRSGPLPNEYGYVSHLDVLLYLINGVKDTNPDEITNLKAEGAPLYKEALKKVPEDEYNLLLQERFFIFDVKGEEISKLCSRIQEAIDRGTSSAHGATFLADWLYSNRGFKEAIEALEKHRKLSEEGILVLVKEAELNAREGNFSEAAKLIHLAKMKEREAENAEVKWSLTYWDLITSFVLEDFQHAYSAQGKLAALNTKKYSPLPRGYIWKEAAKAVIKNKRNFTTHAKIWSGQIQNVRIGGRYGRIDVKNAAGEIFQISFNPQYFHRRDFIPGDQIRFVVAILSEGLRAESIDSKPFVNTVDDIYTKE